MQALRLVSARQAARFAAPGGKQNWRRGLAVEKLVANRPHVGPQPSRGDRPAVITAEVRVMQAHAC